jgi:3-hydroxyisobutyrate dehydrogenase-like beta-hydroxyacid dehydrogenase
MSKADVGVIGLGNMGGGVARNFARAGYSTAVWDSDPAAVARYDVVENAFAATPGQMAADGALMVFVVPATPEIEEYFDGDDGILAMAGEGTVIYDFTKQLVSPTWTLPCPAVRPAQTGAP